MQASRLSVCSLSGEPDFRDGFRNWIKNQVLRLEVYLAINNGHSREAWRVGESACRARVAVWGER